MELKEACNEYLKLFKQIINSANNHIAVGQTSDKDGNKCIAVRLTNENNKYLLPDKFENYHVDIKIIGEIKAGF